MIRTIVYPPRPGVAPAAAPQPADNIPDKLVNYIPAEVVAFYAPVYALVQGETYQWIVLVASLVGTLLYFGARADKGQPPRWFFYPLAVIAFLPGLLGPGLWGKISSSGRSLSVKQPYLLQYFLFPFSTKR